jgi:hypothetical protein
MLSSDLPVNAALLNPQKPTIFATPCNTPRKGVGADFVAMRVHPPNTLSILAGVTGVKKQMKLER